MSQGTPSDRRLSFLAEPGEACDWRLVVLADAAISTGVLDGLPGRPDELAARLSLDEQAVRVALEALATLDVVERDEDGGFAAGPAFPGPDESATLVHHARSLRMWAGSLEDRLRGATIERPSRPPTDAERWLDAMAVNARRTAPGTVDACLARRPSAVTVLELGGGHGEYGSEFARRGLRVTMQDRPEMIDIVRRQGRVEAAGVTLFPGDFFEVLPQGSFDLVFLSGITHTFDGERNRALYASARERLAPGGMFAIQTFVRGRHQVGALFATQMLLAGGGGDTHTEDEYLGWLAEVGLPAVEQVDIEDGRRTLLFASAGAEAGAA